jgi:hypothetical protein
MHSQKIEMIPKSILFKIPILTSGRVYKYTYATEAGVPVNVDPQDKLTSATMPQPTDLASASPLNSGESGVRYTLGHNPRNHDPIF